MSAIGPSSAQFSYTQTGAPQPDFASTSTAGTVNYSQPVATVGLSLGVQGIGINTETQQAVLVDPTTGGVVSFFSLIDQSVSTLTMKTNGVADKNGPTAAAYNPLTNTVVAVDSVSNALSVIDPTAPRRLNDTNLFFNLDGPEVRCRGSTPARTLRWWRIRPAIASRFETGFEFAGLFSVVLDHGDEPKNVYNHFDARQRSEPGPATADCHRQGPHLHGWHDETDRPPRRPSRWITSPALAMAIAN